MVLRALAIGLVGVVFAVAGIAKMVYPLQLVRVFVFLVPSIREYPDVVLALPGVLAGAEVGLASALLIERRRTWPLVGAGVALVGFTVVLAILSLSQGAPSCGCFGLPRGWAGGEGKAGLARNIGLLCLVGWLLGAKQPSRGSVQPGAGKPSALLSHAFTLVELLVVMAVVAVIIALALPPLARTRESARESARLVMIRQLMASLAMYAQDNRERHPFFGTPGEALGPITIRGFEIRGSFFQTQRWLWASAIFPEYLDCPRRAIESEGRAEYMQGQLGWPEFIIAADYHMTSTAFALPPFWSEDPSGGLAWLREEYLQPTTLAHLQYPSQKGVLFLDFAEANDGPANGHAIVGLGDGSSRSIGWWTLDWNKAVARPWGAGGKPIVSTRDGLAGIDF